MAQVESIFGWDEAEGRFGKGLRHLAGRNVPALRRSFGLSQVHRTSSAGRLFDAISALLGLCVEAQSYEGEAAMLLEAAALRSRGGGSYGAEVTPEGPSWRPLFEGVLTGLDRGIAIETIARRAHDTVVDGVTRQVEALCRMHGIHQVALSGGCFNNVLVTDGLHTGLTGLGLSVLVHRRLPPGDGGLAAGQALAALQADVT